MTLTTAPVPGVPGLWCAAPADLGGLGGLLEVVHHPDADIGDVLSFVAATAVDATPAVIAATVTTGPCLLWCHGRGAFRLAEAQTADQPGPANTAGSSLPGQLVASADLRTDRRWPALRARAATCGVAGALSVRLTPTGNGHHPAPAQVQGSEPDPDQELELGPVVLTLYAAAPRHFDPAAHTIAALLSVHAALAIETITARHAATATADQLRRAMTTRATIGQATGILMAAQHCSADQAFDLLSAHSQNHNRKLSEVAADLVARAGRPAASRTPAPGTVMTARPGPARPSPAARRPTSDPSRLPPAGGRLRPRELDGPPE